jgi:hypothetical protein
VGTLHISASAGRETVLVDVLNRTDAGASVPHTWSASGAPRAYGSDHMDTNTLLIIVLVVLLLGGSGFYYNRRGV